MRSMLPEDPGNVNPGHEFICMYVECDFFDVDDDVDVVKKKGVLDEKAKQV